MNRRLLHGLVIGIAVAALVYVGLAVYADWEQLRAALGRLLGDRELRERLGAAARKAAGERFRWSAATAATVDAYRAVLAR